MKSKYHQTIDACIRGMLTDCAERGLSKAQAARELGISQVHVARQADAFGLFFVDGRAGRLVHDPDHLRSRAMAELYRVGFTLQQVGDQFGVSRQRVCQILSKDHGIRRTDGGASVRARAPIQIAEAAE